MSLLHGDSNPCPAALTSTSVASDLISPPAQRGRAGRRAREKIWIHESWMLRGPRGQGLGKSSGGASPRGASPIIIPCANAATRGLEHTNPGHSSPADEVSIGPSGLDRGSGTTHSSVRSHHVVRWQPSAPRRHHCRPPARFKRFWHASAASAGRLPSPRVACQRIWPVREAPEHNLRGRQTARGGALRGASALRPCAAAFANRPGGRATRRAPMPRTNPAAPFRPSNGNSGSLPSQLIPDSDAGCFIFPACDHERLTGRQDGCELTRMCSCLPAARLSHRIVVVVRGRLAASLFSGRTLTSG